MSYDRYTKFRGNGDISKIPYIKIPVKSSDFYTIYKKGKSRLDLISYQYYGDCDYGWLILQANPSVGTLEYDIPDRTRLRIPYPLADTLEQYAEGIDTYKKEYGI